MPFKAITWGFDGFSHKSAFKAHLRASNGCKDRCFNGELHSSGVFLALFNAKWVKLSLKCGNMGNSGGVMRKNRVINLKVCGRISKLLTKAGKNNQIKQKLAKWWKMAKKHCYLGKNSKKYSKSGAIARLTTLWIMKKGSNIWCFLSGFVT